MKIDPTAPQRPASVRRAGAHGGVRSDAFARALADSSPAGGISGGGPIGALNAMLALQEVPDPMDGRTRARRRGEQVLDLLDRIRLGILTGTLSQTELANLAGLVRARREQVDDPRLAEILGEIELRAEVELAKFSRPD
jgi:hypothetical protein